MKRVRLAIIICVLLLLAFGSLAVRCFHLQYFKNADYVAVAARQQHKWSVQKPQRGAILDSKGRLLAASNRLQTIFAEPRRINEPERVAESLSAVLDIEAEEIYNRITQSRNPGFARLKIDAPLDQCAAARRIDRGIGVQDQWQRNYPMSRLFSHVVGFSGADDVGLTGIELYYDDKLSGTPGRDYFFADKFRRSIRLLKNSDEVRDGYSVILTLDAAIQHFVRTELEKRFLEFEAESAVAIVARPQTGEILAMVSLPDFDPEDRNCDPNFFRNRALSDQYEPGSMIKPIAAAIGLDAGVINRQEKIFCENGHYSGRGFGRIGEYDYHKYGNLTVREILVKSSNIGMAKIGQRLERKKMYDGMTLFGFGRRTGIDLPGETTGLLRPPSQWTGYSETRIPFGQEITVTSMQMVRAFCILANGGYAVTPYVVKAVVDQDGNIIRLNRPPPPVGYVIKPEIANWIVTDALVGAVNEKDNGATGWRAKNKKWQVFGKTGTANIALSDQRGYSNRDYVASFIAGAPAENPQIIVLVSIRKPNRSLGKGYTGGAVASPVVGKIIEQTLTYLYGQRDLMNVAYSD
ncbi:MAG: penicillin-binding protein 2 [Phycisphaerae bacterium]